MVKYYLIEHGVQMYKEYDQWYIKYDSLIV